MKLKTAARLWWSIVEWKREGSNKRHTHPIALGSNLAWDITSSLWPNLNATIVSQLSSRMYSNSQKLRLWLTKCVQLLHWFTIVLSLIPVKFWFKPRSEVVRTVLNNWSDRYKNRKLASFFVCTTMLTLALHNPRKYNRLQRSVS